MRFIKCVGGEMSAVYETGEKGYIPHKGVRVTEDTSDEVLFSIGLRVLKKELSKDPKATITRGPFYRPAEDGTATAFEYYQYFSPSLESLRQDKLFLHYGSKDAVMQEGTSYKGYKFDLRFRNICYMTMMLSLINNDTYPEDFSWYTTDGEVVPLSKEECMQFIKLALEKIKVLELESIEVLKKMRSINNVEELSKFDPSIGGKNDL